MTTETIAPSDLAILRDLARRVRDIAADPVMEERRQMWHRHNSLKGGRPMILAETGGVLDELVPVDSLECTGERARGIERGLRNTIFMHEHVNDDSVIEPYIGCNWQVRISDYGVQSEKQHGDNAGRLASYRWDPAIKDLDADFDKLRPRTCNVDREATERTHAMLEEIFDGILPVRRRGSHWWTMGLTWSAIDLIGLEGLMMAMYDNPDGLHRLMAFLRDDHIGVIEWFEAEGLLNLNNENDYVGSGSQGYTDELPQAGFEGTARLKDLWGLSESQETVGVSPQMFAEFIFPYQLPVIERFGLSYYGCCEPVHARWETIKRIPNLRKVSVSPWCDQHLMAQACGDRFIFCRKPNPEIVSKQCFDEAAIRNDISTTLDVAKGCHIELVMKDVHTVADKPERLGRWVQIAREEIEKQN